MSVYPGVTYRPVEWAEDRDDNTPAVCMIFHVSAVEATSLYRSFASNPRACSNFHVPRSASYDTEQYIDTQYLSAADYYGSHRSISVETQGADAYGRWTDHQCEELALLAMNAHRLDGIPLRLMSSSRPGEIGIGWHRLGIDGNFPAAPNILAGRLQRGGGELWSGARGKVCPGDNRIRQIPEILDRAIELNRREGGNAPDRPSRPEVITPRPTKSKEYELMRHLDLRNAHRVPVTGRHVKSLQAQLLAWGHGPAGLVDKGGHPDGVAGAATRRELGEFQRRTKTGARDGSPDHLVGDRTWAALLGLD